MTELSIHPSRGRRRALVALSMALVSAMATVAVGSWLPAAEGQVGGACTPPTPTPATQASGIGTDHTADRTVTLSVDRNTVSYGGRVIMTGTLSDADGTCIPGVNVKIEGETLGTGLAAKGGGDETNDEGVFVAGVKVSASAEYTAVVQETQEDPEVTSAPVTVLSKVAITAQTRDLSPERGTKIEISARMKPSYPGSGAVLQRKRDSGWGNVKTDKADNTGFMFKIKANWKGKRVFRVTWIKPEGADNEPGSSNRLKVKPTKPRDDGGRNRGR